MKRAEDYFLPPEYKCQTECIKSGFWTPQRIAREPFNGSYNVFKWIAETRNALAGESLLDLGCGPASKLPVFFPNAVVTGVDTDEAIVLAKKNNPGGTFFVCDFDNMEMVKKVSSLLGTFSVITCVDVIEHVLHPENILDLIHAHLADRGSAYISTLERDLSRGSQSFHMGSPKKEHVREWNQQEFCQFVESAGFKVREVKITVQAVKPTENDKNFRVQTLLCEKNVSHEGKA